MRCPLRVKAFDKPDECDPECAWLVDVTMNDGYVPETEPRRVCAVTALAIGIHYYNVEPLNTMEVDDGREASE